MGTANQSEHQITYMVNRFLQWKLPKDFQPDCGIHFDANAAKKLNPNNHTYEPVGTNLLSADQAKEMVRFMIDGLPSSGTTPGTALIAGERKRQEAEEGWTPEHDDTEHRYGDLTQAAVSYAQNAICQIQHSDYPRPISWPWKVAWWKPSADPIRNLVKAGALIAAEIDRLLRKRTADSTVLDHSEIRRGTDCPVCLGGTAFGFKRIPCNICGGG